MDTEKSHETEKQDETLPAPTETAGELVAGETEIVETPVSTGENDIVVDLEEEEDDEDDGRCLYGPLCSAIGLTKYECRLCGGLYHHMCANKVFGVDFGDGCGCVEEEKRRKRASGSEIARSKKSKSTRSSIPGPEAATEIDGVPTASLSAVMTAPKSILTVYGTKLSALKRGSIVVFRDKFLAGESDVWISGKVYQLVDDDVAVQIAISDSLYTYEDDEVHRINMKNVIPASNFVLNSMARYIYFGAPTRVSKDLQWFDRQVDSEMKFNMLECRDVFATNGHYWLILGFFKRFGETKVLMLYRPHSMDHMDDEKHVLPRLAQTSASAMAHNFPIADPAQRKYGLYLFDDMDDKSKRQIKKIHVKVANIAAFAIKTDFDLRTYGALNSKPNEPFDVMSGSFPLDFQPVTPGTNEQAKFTAVPNKNPLPVKIKPKRSQPPPQASSSPKNDPPVTAARPRTRPSLKRGDETPVTPMKRSKGSESVQEMVTPSPSPSPTPSTSPLSSSTDPALLNLFLSMQRETSQDVRSQLEGAHRDKVTWMESIIAKKDREISLLEESLAMARREATKSSDIGKEEREALLILRTKVTDLEDHLKNQKEKHQSEMTNATTTIEALRSEVTGLRRELQEASEKVQASEVEVQALHGMRVDMPKVLQSVQDVLREEFRALVATHELTTKSTALPVPVPVPVPQPQQVMHSYPVHVAMQQPVSSSAPMMSQIPHQMHQMPQMYSSFPMQHGSAIPSTQLTADQPGAPPQPMPQAYSYRPYDYSMQYPPPPQPSPQQRHGDQR